MEANRHTSAWSSEGFWGRSEAKPPADVTGGSPVASTPGTRAATHSWPRRLWQYQKERFPLVAHGPLIGAFSFSAVSLSSMLRGHTGVPSLPSIVVALAVCLLFFLQLRIADEFKDFEDDSRYRPYRAVPRGLVSLRELGVVFVFAAMVQLALAWWLDPALLFVLFVVWLYLAAMTKEFFVREYLEGRPLLYLVSHMVIMPLVDLYATGADWLVAGGGPPVGIGWFLAASFFNGMSLDVGRKIRSPADEEQGVETYSVVWGRGRAVLAWWIVLALTALCAVLVAARIDFLWPVAMLLGGMFVGALIVGAVFLCKPLPGRGKLIEHYSAAWTLVLYLGLGAAPLVWRALS
jgi:4-hydroxybenzoate polyprenyltransferase